MTLTYNIGTMADVVLREPVSVADGKYHNVVISRNYLNATMDVDQYPQRSTKQKGCLIFVSHNIHKKKNKIKLRRSFLYQSV